MPPLSTLRVLISLGFGIAGDHIGKNHAVVIRDFYEGKSHSTENARFLHTIEIGPYDPSFNKDGLLFGYFDDHLVDFILVDLFSAVDEYAGDSNISGFSLYGAFLRNNRNRPSHRDSGVSPFLNTIRQF